MENKSIWLDTSYNRWKASWPDKMYLIESNSTNKLILSNMKDTHEQLQDFFTYLEDLYNDKYITELNEYDTDIY